MIFNGTRVGRHLSFTKLDLVFLPLRSQSCQELRSLLGIRSLEKSDLVNERQAHEPLEHDLLGIGPGLV